jgi:hemerythrin superfamily protein
MPRTRSAASSSTSRARKSADAIALLKADHQEAKKLFDQYDKLAKAEASADERQAVADEICSKLSAHSQYEEEIFYPAARGVLDEHDLVDEAAVEHATTKDLIGQIGNMSPDDDLYDAKVKVLAEYINHHVKEEEGELFTKVKKAGLDLEQVGVALAERKAELLSRGAEPH